VLDALGPAGPQWAGTALEGRLLAAPAPVAAGNPVTAKVLEALGKLGAIGAPGAEGGLFGWDPDPAGHAQPRGIAGAVRIDGGAGQVFAGALAVTAPGGVPRLEVVGSGTLDGLSGALALDPAWTLRVGGRLAGSLGVAIGAAGAPVVEAGSAGDTVRLALARLAPGADAGAGPGIDLGALDLSAELRLAPGGAPTLRGRLGISGGAVRLAPGDFSALVPGLGPIPLDVDLGLDSGRGVDLAGSPTLAAHLPTAPSLPGISAGPLDVGLQPGAIDVRVRVTTELAADLPGVPIHLALAGAGLEVPFSLGGAALGFDLGALAPVSPSGAGVELSLPLIKSAGRVDRTADGQYAGLLAVVMPPLSVDAYGVLGLEPLSFLVVLGATFPPPGIQIGFGFAITGVGGVVGVGRRVDRDALSRAVVDGTAAALLFPTDPAGQSAQVTAALPQIFPPAPGRAVAGPMFQLSWGGRLVSASLALLLELPDPVRISLLGKLLVAIPDPDLPLVRIQVTFFGQIDTGEPSVFFLASLAGSSIVGIPLTGDMCLLTRGGSGAEFVLSAGGFHPRFRAPRGVPPLARLGLDLSPASFLDMRCQAYMAVTSNTVQFGARVDLVAEIADCGLRGHLGFDVLVQLQPLHFIAEVSAGISVEVIGETLAGIDLDLALEGPAKWRARGRGSVELFGFSASFDFDESWGSSPPEPLSTPDVASLLATAYAAREAWVVRPPDPAASPVGLTSGAARALADGTVVHPHGSLSAHQRVVPLGITIERFNRLPVPAQRWDVSDPVLGAGRPVTVSAEQREEFAPGQFLALSDDEQLGRPAFESFRVGLDFVAADVVLADPRPADLAYETKVIAEDSAQPLPLELGGLLDSVEAVAGAGIDHELWWQKPADRVTVAATPSFAIADAWSFTAAPDMPVAPGVTATEVHQAVAALRATDPRRRVGVVEAWELAG
jgi:hypothetical protein